MENKTDYMAVMAERWDIFKEGCVTFGHDMVEMASTAWNTVFAEGTFAHTLFTDPIEIVGAILAYLFIAYIVLSILHRIFSFSKGVLFLVFLPVILPGLLIYSIFKKRAHYKAYYEESDEDYGTFGSGNQGVGPDSRKVFAWADRGPDLPAVPAPSKRKKGKPTEEEIRAFFGPTDLTPLD